MTTIADFLRLMEQPRGMIISSESNRDFKFYFEGLIVGIGSMSGTNIMKMMNEWVQNQKYARFSTNWLDFIFRSLDKNDGKETEAVLLP